MKDQKQMCSVHCFSRQIRLHLDKLNLICPWDIRWKCSAGSWIDEPTAFRGTSILSGVNRKCYSKWWDHHGESVWSETSCGPRIDSWQTQYLKEDWRRGNHEGEHSRIYQRDNVTVSKKSIEIMAKTFFFCQVGNMEITNDFGKMVWTSPNAASKRMKIVLFCFAFSNCWRSSNRGCFHGSRTRWTSLWAFSVVST